MALFTVETSRIAVQKSLAARKLKRERQVIEASAVQNIEAMLRAQNSEKIAVAQTSVVNEAYVSTTLVRVRKQIDQLLDALDEEIAKAAGLDHQRLDRITAGLDRLIKTEQLLACRPGPGSYKPTAPRRSIAPTVEPVNPDTQGS